MNFLAERDRRPEWMDQPQLDRQLHTQALCGLRLTNSISRVARVVWQGIVAAGIRTTNSLPIRILDIASGGGDVVIGVSALAARNGVAVEAHGCDVSATAVAHAENAARAAGAIQTRFFQFNALVDPLPDNYDIVMCTLFLHHLDETNAGELLRRMSLAARQCILVDDLLRNWLGYLYASAGARLLTRSPIVHTDGPLSVRAAFTLPEIERLARDAGLHGARFRCHWPQRFLLTWRKK